MHVDAERPALEQSKIRRAAFVFLLGSLAIIVVTLVATIKEETWRGAAAPIRMQSAGIRRGWKFAAVTRIRKAWHSRITTWE